MAYIAYKDNLFHVVQADFDQRALYKLLGFTWSPLRRSWVTPALDVAMSLTGVSWTKSASDYAAQCLATAEAAYEMSWQDDTDYQPPVPDRINPKTGEKYALFPYQRAGVAYALPRKDTLIGDQPGLGKTPQAVVIGNASGARFHLVVCPASLKENWRREFLAWSTIEGQTVGIAEASFIEKVPDGVYKTGKRAGEVKYRNVEHRDVWPDTDVVIINYDILHRFKEQIHARMWDQLTCDECHALKSDTSKRTLFVLGGTDNKTRDPETRKFVWWPAVEARRRVFLSGTPMLNRPIELWPMVHAFDRSGLGKNKRHFEERYCGGHYVGAGGMKINGRMVERARFDNSGATHLEELGTKLRETFMVRRLKAEVLPDLPPKRRIVVTLASAEINDLVAREDEIAQMLKLYERHVADEAMEGLDQGWLHDETLAREAVQGTMVAVRADHMNLHEVFKSEDGEPNFRLLNMDYACAVTGLEPPAVQILFEEMASVRRDLGIAKLSAAVPWIKDFLDGGEKLLVFAYHAAVVEGVRDALAAYQPAVVYGKTPQRRRQGEVDRFQEDESCRVFDGNMHAAGVGFTMTRAADAAFVEGDWVPGIMEQCLDRACRIGQKADLVTGYHLVANGSLDARIAQSEKLKADNIQMAMDTRDAEKLKLAA